MTRSILVTGGAGYIGSVVVEQLLALGHSVVVLDDLSRGHRAAVDPRAEFLQGRIADRPVLDELLARRPCDALVHLAAYALVAESVAHPDMYFTNNVTGGRVLLDAVVAAGVRRVIFSSSCAVYGHPPVIPIAEDAPRAPVNPYGETNLAFEQLLADYAARHGVGSISLHYVHIADIADAHVRALDAAVPGAVAVNLGTGAGHSVLAVTEAARRIPGRPIPTVACPRRPGDPPALVAAPGRAEQLLGWRPRHSRLDEILASAWEWHPTHPSRYPN